MVGEGSIRQTSPFRRVRLELPVVDKGSTRQTSNSGGQQGFHQWFLPRFWVSKDLTEDFLPVLAFGWASLKFQRLFWCRKGVWLRNYSLAVFGWGFSGDFLVLFGLVF
ncbi:hypothetical protein U1Q18_052444 [Sarracenia purpurea var. burkii]